MIADKKVDPKSVTASGAGRKNIKGRCNGCLSNPGKKAFAGTELFSRNVRTEENE